jgi:hypothetical protein
MAQRGAGRRIVEGVPLVAVLWTWALPATVLWRLAVSRDLVVPYVPWFVWVVPGRLWAFSPALWCIGLALATLAAYLVSKAALPQRKNVVRGIWVLTFSIGAVHLLWGSAVIRAAHAREVGSVRVAQTPEDRVRRLFRVARHSRDRDVLPFQANDRAHR